MPKEDFEPRKRRMLVNVKLVKDPISRTGYSMTMEGSGGIFGKKFFFLISEFFSDPGHTDPPILNI